MITKSVIPKSVARAFEEGGEDAYWKAFEKADLRDMTEDLSVDKSDRLLTLIPHGTKSFAE